MLSGTPGSLIINLTSKKSRLSVSVFIDFIQRMYTSEKSKKNLESTEEFDFSIF